MLCQLSVAGLYENPLSGAAVLVAPFKTIILLPVHTAAWRERADGAPELLNALQVLLVGLYLAPSPKYVDPAAFDPPQTIISVPVQTTLWLSLAVGALIVETGVQLLVVGL